MLQQQLPCIDKLLLTCLVKVEPIDLFTCDICHAVYCEEDKLTRHLATHVKCEDTLVHNTRDGLSRCATSYESQFDENAMDSVTQQPYIPIRDRIMFESDSDDSLDDTETLENSLMNVLSDGASVSNNNCELSSENNLKIEQNTHISYSEALNKNLQGGRLQCHKKKKSKPTPVSRNNLPRKKYTSKIIYQGQVTGATDNCDQQFGLQNGHEQIQTIRQYTCGTCPKTFLTKRSLRQHLKLHSLDKTIECEICEKRFMFKHQLKVHQRLHTNERPYSCKICNIPFRHYSSLSLHKRSAHANLNDPTNVKEQPTCAICNKRFCQKSNLLRHIYIFHVTMGYPCSVCKKEFGHPIALNWHMNLHKGTFKCCVCGKSFEKQDYAKKCEVSHKKPFECSNCNMKFGRKYHLTRHQKDHCKKLSPNLQRKLFKCQHCNKEYLRKEYLTQHFKLHCELNSRECAACKITFSGTMNNHNRVCKWKKYQCDLCKKKFSLKKKMTNHIINRICKKKLR